MDISKHPLVKKGYIPLDKSLIIRMGVLDILHGYTDIISFLKENYSSLSDDLKSSYEAFSDWNNNKRIIHVGESATLYRFLRFASLKLKLDKKFSLERTLKTREICDNPDIVNYSLKELLKLDNKTSQWASASYLIGKRKKVKNPPYKLQLTYDAVEHWDKKRKKGLCWEPRYDETILRQAEAFVKLQNQKDFPKFKPRHSEDGPFAAVLGFMTIDEYKERFSSSKTQESNRPEEIEKEFCNLRVGKPIQSKDHRIVQAYEMFQKFLGFPIKAEYPDAVSKSWPRRQFERFLHDAPSLSLS